MTDSMVLPLGMDEEAFRKLFLAYARRGELYKLNKGRREALKRYKEEHPSMEEESEFLIKDLDKLAEMGMDISGIKVNDSNRRYRLVVRLPGEKRGTSVAAFDTLDDVEDLLESMRGEFPDGTLVYVVRGRGCLAGMYLRSRLYKVEGGVPTKVRDL